MKFPALAFFLAIREGRAPSKEILLVPNKDEATEMDLPSWVIRKIPDGRHVEMGLSGYLRGVSVRKVIEITKGELNGAEPAFFDCSLFVCILDQKNKVKTVHSATFVNLKDAHKMNLSRRVKAILHLSRLQSYLI